MANRGTLTTLAKEDENNEAEKPEKEEKNKLLNEPSPRHAWQNNHIQPLTEIDGCLGVGGWFLHVYMKYQKNET